MKTTKPPEALENAGDPHVVAVGFSSKSDWFRRLPRACLFKTKQSRGKTNAISHCTRHAFKNFSGENQC